MFLPLDEVKMQLELPLNLQLHNVGLTYAYICRTSNFPFNFLEYQLNYNFHHQAIRKI